jgi:apolipoprotein N-acyltransferase
MVIDVQRLGTHSSERWALAALAGLLNGVGFIYWGPMSLVANVPLLLALHRSPSAIETAFLGGLVGILGGIHIYGIVNYGWFLLLGFSLYTASQMVIYASLFRLLRGSKWPWMDVLLPALLWTLSEWIRTVGPLCMPASYVGNIADTAWLHPWLYLASLTGGLGVSSLIAAIQGVIFYALIGDQNQRRSAGIIFAGILCLAPAGLLIAPIDGDRDVSIVAVQGGLANSQYHAAQADPAAMRDVVNTYERLTQAAYQKEADFVIWPETAIRAPVLRTPELRARLFPPKGSPSVLLAGLIETDLKGRRYNVLSAIGAGDQVFGRYAKFRLVPGTEAHFTSGEGFIPMTIPGGQVGALICLESVYPDSARTLVSKGAEFLVVASNDAGFGWSPITEHMTNRAIVRAVETRRWLVRVGQAGVSTVISPRGEQMADLEIFKPGLLSERIERRDDKSLFVRWGDWWMGIILLLLAGALLSRRRD